MPLKNAAELNSKAQRINSSLKNTPSTRVREPITRSRGNLIQIQQRRIVLHLIF